MTAATSDVAMGAAKRRPIGLAGLGRMGMPMAKRLLVAGFDLTVWNKSPESLVEACAAGASAAPTPADMAARVETILLMLANGDAADAVLGRQGSALAVKVADKLVIQLGTTSPNYSQALGAAITKAGGRYVEAPVSGSQIPAERGTLVAMLGANAEADFVAAEQVLACLTSRIFRAGPVPSAMQLKLAVNAFLIPLVSALGEAWRLCERLGLDPTLLKEVLDCSPMASDVSRMKLDKLIRNDFTAQASIDDVYMNTKLVLDLAAGSHCQMELIAACASLLEQAQQAGHAKLDVIALGHTAR